MNETFKELFNNIIKKQKIKEHNIIKGKIIEINKNSVLIDSNLKSESYIPIKQFKDIKGKIKIKINDIINLYIENIESGNGETILSREKAKYYETWKSLERSYTDSSIINGIIIGRVKGGFTVNVNGIKSFLPGSLVDIKPIKDFSLIENKILEFKVIKLDKKNNNIVLSRKAAMLLDNNKERKKLLSKMYEGSIVKGIVKNITDYGVFIDLGGIDGLLHITDMSWKRIRHPGEILKIGKEIKTKIIKFDKIKTRVSLGLKQLTKDPWKNILENYPINSTINGRITNLTDYGCFIEIEEGIEGLAHISEIDWVNKNINPFKIFKIGESTKAVILNIDKNKRRISLGIKQCKPNPWLEFFKKYKIGEKIQGTVKSITDFGIFLGLKEGIDGLIHTTDISWNEEIEKIKKKYKKGKKINAIILKIETEKERISLGIKQLTEDPLNKYKNNLENKIYNFKISNIDKNYIHLFIENSIKGYIKISEIKKNKKIIKKIKINDYLKTQIKKININKRQIELKLIKNKKNKNKIKKNKNNINCFNAMVEAFKQAKKK